VRVEVGRDPVEISSMNHEVEVAVCSALLTQQTVNPPPSVEPVVHPESIQVAQQHQHVGGLHPTSISGDK
jgi:hypothetical protein